VNELFRALPHLLAGAPSIPRWIPEERALAARVHLARVAVGGFRTVQLLERRLDTRLAGRDVVAECPADPALAQWMADGVAFKLLPFLPDDQWDNLEAWLTARDLWLGLLRRAGVEVFGSRGAEVSNLSRLLTGPMWKRVGRGVLRRDGDHRRAAHLREQGLHVLLSAELEAPGWVRATCDYLHQAFL
jgi:hypothetical protein